MEERELVERCVAGDGDAWSEFLSRYKGTIDQLARTYLRSLDGGGDEGRVEEVSAGVLEMLVAHDRRILRLFRWQCSLETWLRVLVRTVTVRSVRRKRLNPRDLPRPATPVAPLDQLLSEERTGAVRKALESLPERERLVLSMFLVDGKSYQDISQALRMPMGTIATVLARTRQRLREILEAGGF